MASEIKHYLFKEGLPLGFEITSVGEIYSRSRGLLITPHRNAFYNIIWFQQGSPVHLIDFKPVQIHSDVLLFVGKDTVQIFDSKTPFDAKIILFTDDFFCKEDSDTKYLGSNILFNDFLDISKIELLNASDMFKALWSLMELEQNRAADHYHRDLLKNYLHNFLLLAEREKRKQGFKEIPKNLELDYLLLFKDVLEKDFKVQKSVKYYSDHLCIPNKRLTHATLKTLGRTPKQMIEERVLLEAKRLIVHSNESVKSIGFTLGFDQTTNFIKFFRKHTETTPNRFREDHFL